MQSQITMIDVDNQSEKIEILNNLGQKTTQTTTRKLIHEQGNWHKSVHLYIIDKENRVLFQRRSHKKLLFASLLACPVGGHIEAGSDSLSTLLREAEEEISLKVIPNNLIYLGIDRIGFSNSDRSLFEKEFVHIYLLDGDYDLNLNLKNDEVEALYWLDFEDFKKRIRAKDHEFMPCWIIYEKIIDYIENLRGLI